MRTTAYKKINAYAGEIINELQTANIEPTTKKIIASFVNKILTECEVEHLANNGETLKAYEAKTQLSANELLVSDEYVAMVNMKQYDTATIRCSAERFSFLRSLIKKNFPSARFRSSLLPNGDRLITRIQ